MLNLFPYHGDFLRLYIFKSFKNVICTNVNILLNFYTFFWIRILNVDPDPATPILSIIFLVLGIRIRDSFVTPVPGSGIRNSDFFDNFEIVCVLCVGCSPFFGADYRHWLEGNQPSSLNFCCTGQCFCVDACILIWFSQFFYCNSTFCVLDTHRFNADIDPNFYWVRTRIEHKY